MSAFTQDFIVQKPNRKKHKPAAMDVPARLWNPDGTPFEASTAPAAGSVTTEQLADGAVTAAKLAKGVLPAAYTLPAATAAALGGVKQGVAVPNVAADADAAALASAFNGLLTQLRAAGVIATK